MHFHQCKLYPLLFLLLALVFPMHVAALDKVRLQLRDEHQFQFAGYYAALWQGLYKEAGIELEILPGVDANGKLVSVVDRVSAGMADCGIGSGDILFAVDQGVPLVIVASIFQQSPVAVFARKEVGLSSPADLFQLKVLGGQSSLVDVEVLSMLRAEGIDPARLTLIRTAKTTSASEAYTLLFSGEVDAIFGNTFSVPWFAKEQGVALTQMRPSAYGVDFYGDSLFCNRHMLEKNPKLISRLLAASMKGWRYALENPQEIIERIITDLPSNQKVQDLRAYNQFLADRVRRLTLYPVVEIGHINPSRWEGMYRSMAAAGLVSQPLDVKALIFDRPRERLDRKYKQFKTGALILSLLILIAGALALSSRFKLKLIRERMTRALRKNEKMLSAIFDQTFQFIQLLSPEGKVIKFNSAALSFAGVKESEVTGKFCWETPWWNVSSEVEGQLKRAVNHVADGQFLRYETPLFLFRDELHCIDISLKPVLDENGKTSLIILEGRDITARKLAEEKVEDHVHYLKMLDRINALFLRSRNLEDLQLHLLEELLLIFHSDRVWLLPPLDFDNAYWSVPREWRREGFSPAFLGQESFPMTAEAAARMRVIYTLEHPLELWSEEGVELPAELLADVKSGMIHSIHPRHDGPWLLMILHSSSHHEYSESEKDLLKAICTQVADFFTNLTLLQDLIKSEVKYRTLVDHLPQRIFIKDRNSVYVSCNDNYARDLGIDSEEIAGKTDNELFHEMVAQRHQAGDRRILQTGDTEEFEEPYFLHDQERWIQMVKTPVINDQGEINGVLGIFWDITAQKKNLDELKKHREQLEALVAARTQELTNVNKELEAFTSAVSHDLRAPLRGVDGFSLALEEGFSEKLGDRGKDYLRRVREAVARMSRLIDDLLSLSQVGRSELQCRQVNISRMAHEVCARLEGGEPQRRMKVQIAEGLKANGDAGLLLIVLENLLNNAWKYTLKIEQSLIEVGAQQEGTETVFFVRDNGAGFNMRYVENLFTAFRRLHKDDQFPGTGIGLATVQRIIHRHGGRIWAESVPGEGATFYFTLPSGSGL